MLSVCQSKCLILPDENKLESKYGFSLEWVNFYYSWHVVLLCFSVPKRAIGTLSALNREIKCSWSQHMGHLKHKQPVYFSQEKP